VEIVRRSGVPVRVTAKEKTLLDLFLFSPFHTGSAHRGARIPEEIFLEALARCVDDPGFYFDMFHEIAAVFRCEKKR
jgi:hypothetical protein